MVLSYDKGKLEELLSSFYVLTGIRIVVFDFDLKKIAEAPGYDCQFCKLIRLDKTAEQQCHASDLHACEQSRRLNKLHSYTCHAGLTETVTPIRYEKIIIGYLMFGQVLEEKDFETGWTEVEVCCSGYKINKDELYSAFMKLTHVTKEQVLSAAKILEACAGLLYLERSLSLRENDLANQINEYITNNLDADLSVYELCNRFHISRSRLYKITNEYHGRGVEQLTRALRIAKAKELLRDTDQKVSEVARHVGYADYNYFIKVFKSEAGVTPLRYKKQYCYF